MGDGAMCHYCRRYECICAEEQPAITDTQRLDWVLENRAVVLDGCVYRQCAWTTGYLCGEHIEINPVSLAEHRRAAIDAAIRAQEGKR